MAKGMTRWQGHKEKKEQKSRKAYADYLRNKRWGGKEEHKKALSYYQWKQEQKAGPKQSQTYGQKPSRRTRKISSQIGSALTEEEKKRLR